MVFFKVSLILLCTFTYEIKSTKWKMCCALIFHSLSYYFATITKKFIINNLKYVFKWYSNIGFFIRLSSCVVLSKKNIATTTAMNQSLKKGKKITKNVWSPKRLVECSAFYLGKTVDSSDFSVFFAGNQ